MLVKNNIITGLILTRKYNNNNNGSVTAPFLNINMERKEIIDFIRFCIGGLIGFCVIAFCITFAIVFLFASADIIYQSYNHFILPYVV